MFVEIAQSTSVTYTIPARYIMDSTTGCLTAYQLTAPSNSYLAAMVSFNQFTDTVTITGGTDDANHIALMGANTIEFPVISQAGTALTGKKFTVTLTVDHALCASFTR